MPAMPIADNSAPIVVGIRADQQRDQVCDIDTGVEIGRHGRHRRDDDDKDQSQYGEQDGEGNFIGGLLSFRPFHQPNHAIEEAFPRVGDRADEQPVRDQLGASRYRGEYVGAGLLHDGRRLPRDGGFIDIGRTLDHLAVGRDKLRLVHPENIPLPDSGRGRQLELPCGLDAFRREFRLRPTQRGGLCFASAFGKRLRSVCEPHGQKQDQCHQAVVSRARGSGPKQLRIHRQSCGD